MRPARDEAWAIATALRLLDEHQAWVAAKVRGMRDRALAEKLRRRASEDAARVVREAPRVRRTWLAYWIELPHRLLPGERAHVMPNVTLVRVSRLTGRAAFVPLL